MIRFYGKVYDEFVSGNGTLYTGVRGAETMGVGDLIGIHLVLTQVSNFNTLSLQIQHSGDGINWLNKNAAPEIPVTSITGTSASLYGGESWPARPSLDFIRFAITISGVAAPPSGRLQIHVVVRDKSARDDSACSCEGSPKKGHHEKQDISKERDVTGGDPADVHHGSGSIVGPVHHLGLHADLDTRIAKLVCAAGLWERGVAVGGGGIGQKITLQALAGGAAMMSNSEASGVSSAPPSGHHGFVTKSRGQPSAPRAAALRALSPADRRQLFLPVDDNYSCRLPPGFSSFFIGPSLVISSPP